MIAICPKCNSRFRVQFSDIGPEGRKVRCGECGEVWFQEPVDDNSDGQPGDDDLEDEDEDEDEGDSALDGAVDDEAQDLDPALIEDIFDAIEEEAMEDEEEDIPESLKPLSDDPFMAAFIAEEQGKNKLYGYGAAGGVFVLTFIVFLLLHGPVTHAWPSAQGAYGIFGVGMEVPGQGLVFDRMHVAEKNGALHVEGNILNLGRDDKTVPMIEASLKSKEGEVITRWYILPPKSTLEAEGILPFKSVYHVDKNAIEGAEEAHIRFTLKAKTDAEGDENTHAPQENAPAHPRAHEES